MVESASDCPIPVTLYGLPGIISCADRILEMAKHLEVRVERCAAKDVLANEILA